MKLINIVLLLFLPLGLAANPVSDLLERLQTGASKHFLIQKTDSETDFFELKSQDDKIVITGNTYVNISTGLNWYLKYYLHTNCSWNNMTVSFPDKLPPIKGVERHTTPHSLRYDFNYCTHSYSMAFWNWERWEKEIDWMALHGINLPLAITGTECVWYNLLHRLGYNKNEINEFISGPAFFAWWLMNNLEGWGGPNPDSWYAGRLALQKKIIRRMRELDIHPVFAGYSGMLPHNAREKLGLEVANPGLWCDYKRPSFLQPTDPHFGKIAALYYKEMTRLFGKADYYSMDPFHEGGSTEGVDLQTAGSAIMTAMKKCNPKATWVIQAWGNNPREDMIKHLDHGSLLVLDLFSESRPQWGAPASTWYRKEGFNGHDWLYCMLLNFGGNVGLHGKMQHVIDSYFDARSSAFGSSLKGIGMTMEGIENNPVMFELFCELPWRDSRFTKEDWLKSYVTARYGRYNEAIYQSWLTLSNSIYACPATSVQQGTHESVFCARPSSHVYQVSTWSEMSDYYNPYDVISAASQFASVAEEFRGNNNYEYDLVDICRQSLAEQGRMVYKMMMDARRMANKALFVECSRQFMNLLYAQDELLSTRPEFCFDTWVRRAESWGRTAVEKTLYQWNARVQVTTWGQRSAADNGGLHDYSHREWSGLLKDFYAMRWKLYLDTLLRDFTNTSEPAIDYYAIEEEWVNSPHQYKARNLSSPVDVVKKIRSQMSASE